MLPFNGYMRGYERGRAGQRTVNLIELVFQRGRRAHIKQPLADPIRLRARSQP